MNQIKAHDLAAFEMHQRVRVRGTEITARVQAILLNDKGTQYQIYFWNDGVRRTEWVFPEELEAEK